MNFFARILQEIKYFFSLIFMPNSPATLRRKQLKFIFSELKKLPNELISKDFYLQPELAKIIFQLYLETLPIKSIFQSTIMSPDIRVATQFEDMLLKETFTADQKKAYNSFKFSERESDLRREVVASIEIIQRRLKEQVKNFHSFKQTLYSTNVKDAEQTIQKIYALYDFCNFDFYSFFSNFTTVSESKFSEIVKSGATPKFHQILANNVLKELLDLEFLIKNLDLSSDLIRAVELMHKLVALPSENKFFLVVQKITGIKEILEKKLTPETVLNIIRYVKGDPEFEDKTEFRETKVIDDFSERFESRFTADSKRLLLLFQENKIDKMIEDTFGKQKFFTFSGYNEEINTKLKQATSLSFDWIRPMELLRTFTKQSFEINMKNLLKTVLVEGFFVDNKFQNRLGAAFYYCEGLSNKFENFERLFGVGGDCNLDEIKSLLNEINEGANLEKVLEKIVENANLIAKELVQNAVEQYTALYDVCSQLLSESRKHSSDLVSNIKALFLSTKNRSYVAFFERDVELLGKFLEIMKNYAVLVKIDVA